jgi:hypothetical protein
MRVPTMMYSSIDQSEAARIAFYMQLFSQVRIRRVNFEWQWEESAALIWPEYRNSFSFGRDMAPGLKQTQVQLDSAGAIASHRFGSILDNLATPSALIWSRYRPAGPNAKYLWRRRKVREYFTDLTHTIWRHRYRPESNFAGQNFANWQALGVFGNMGMWIEKLDTTGGAKPGISYRGTPPGEIYVLQNHQGSVDGCIRHFRRTARAIRQLCDYLGAVFPAPLEAALEIGSQQLFNFLHIIHPNADFVPWEKLTPRGKRFTSVIFCVEDQGHIMHESGYPKFPLVFSRYMQAPDEDYGRGPAQMVLPALKTINAQKKSFLTQGHLAGEPAWLLPEEGLTDFRAHAGAFNYGGISPEGKVLVGTLPTGVIQTTEEMMKMETAYIGSAFLVDLFQLTWDTNNTQKSAREVIEMANEKGVFLAPGVGRQNSEYVGPLNVREVEVLAEQHLLPEMPEELKEASGEFTVEICSPLANYMKGQEIAGFMQTVETAINVANATGDKSVLFPFAFKRAFPAMAERRNAPEDWMSTPQEIAEMEKAAAQAAQADQENKALPGKAAIMKAQAITAKAQTGGNVGGTLSGTPQGGMPQVPGNPPGQPGQPGAPGQPGTPGTPGPQG